MRKVSAVLNALTGVHVTQGALTQDARQRAEEPQFITYGPAIAMQKCRRQGYSVLRRQAFPSPP